MSIGKGEPTTPEQMQALIQRADKDKMRRPMERLTAVRATVPVPEPQPEEAAETKPEES